MISRDTQKNKRQTSQACWWQKGLGRSSPSTVFIVQIGESEHGRGKEPRMRCGNSTVPIFILASNLVSNYCISILPEGRDVPIKIAIPWLRGMQKEGREEGRNERRKEKKKERRRNSLWAKCTYFTWDWNINKPGITDIWNHLFYVFIS